MTREERLATKDKVALEKGRLMQRSGPAARMYRANAPGPDGLTCPEPIAAGYLAGKWTLHAYILRLPANTVLELAQTLIGFILT